MLVWGATGGIGGYAVQYVLNGGGTPIGVVSSPDKAALLNELGCRGGHRPQGRGLPLLVGRRHTQDESEWRRFGKKCRELDRRGPRHRVRAPRPPDDGRVDLRRQARRHRRHVRGDVGLHDRVRQPPLLDEAEAADLQPLRQLRRGLRRQPARRPGPHPAAAVGRAPADRGRRRRPRDPPQRARGQDRRAVPGARRGPRHRRPREARPHRRGQDHRSSAAMAADHPALRDSARCA